MNIFQKTNLIDSAESLLRWLRTGKNPMCEITEKALSAKETVYGYLEIKESLVKEIIQSKLQNVEVFLKETNCDFSRTVEHICTIMTNRINTLSEIAIIHELLNNSKSTTITIRLSELDKKIQNFLAEALDKISRKFSYFNNSCNIAISLIYALHETKASISRQISVLTEKATENEIYFILKKLMAPYQLARIATPLFYI